MPVSPGSIGLPNSVPIHSLHGRFGDVGVYGPHVLDSTGLTAGTTADSILQGVMTAPASSVRTNRSTPGVERPAGPRMTRKGAREGDARAPGRGGAPESLVHRPSRAGQAGRSQTVASGGSVSVMLVSLPCAGTASGFSGSVLRTSLPP